MKVLSEREPQLTDLHYKTLKIVIYFTVALSAISLVSTVIYAIGPIIYACALHFLLDEKIEKWPLVLKVE